MTKMVVYVDIDETICHYVGDRVYEKAIPLPDNISVINQMYDEGCSIVYWTARGAVTGIDHSELTRSQLEKWGAKFHELKLGKPHYDLFICDKAIASDVFFKANNEEAKRST